MTTIYWPLAEVASLAEAVLAAGEHRDSWLDAEMGVKTGPALMWVKDDGTYLMGNQDLPDLPDVIYGRDGSPDGPVLDGSDYERVREVCGGDDFAEYLPVDLRFTRNLRMAQSLGSRWWTIEVRGDSITAGPEEPPRRPRKTTRRATAGDLRDGDLVSYSGRVANLSKSATGKTVEYDVLWPTGASSHYRQRASTAVFVYEEVPA